MDNEIEVKFTLGQVNAVLQRLGQLPYASVADLIEGIKGIVVPQLPEESKQEVEPSAPQGE